MAAWPWPMQISLHAFLLMTTTTLLQSWFAITNRVCEVCSGIWSEATSPWPTILRRKPFSGLTRTCGAFAARRVFRPGFTESPTIVSGKKRGRERNSLASMKLNWRPNTIRKPSIPLSDMISPALSNYFPSTSGAPLSCVAKTVFPTMRLRVFSTFRSAL